jgi:hypothetical protein
MTHSRAGSRPPDLGERALVDALRCTSSILSSDTRLRRSRSTRRIRAGVGCEIERALTARSRAECDSARTPVGTAGARVLLRYPARRRSPPRGARSPAARVGAGRASGRPPQVVQLRAQSLEAVLHLHGNDEVAVQRDFRSSSKREEARAPRCDGGDREPAPASLGARPLSPAVPLEGRARGGEGRLSSGPWALETKPAS